MTIHEAEKRMAEMLFLNALKLIKSKEIRGAATMPAKQTGWIKWAEDHLRQREGCGDERLLAALIEAREAGF